MSEASVMKEVKVDFVGVGFFNNLNDPHLHMLYIVYPTLM